MSERLDLYPIAVMEDRYGGSYSKGKWVAFSNADGDGRMEEVWSGPMGGDPDAWAFWDSPPEWIAVGATPDAAVAALIAKNPTRKR